MVREQILKARTFSRAELLTNQRKKENEDELVLNITYHSSLAQLKIIMTRIHLLLTPNSEHNKVFRDVSIIGFRRSKSLKDILVRAKIPQVGAALVKDLDMKYANILYLLEILHLLQNAHMRLDQKI